MGKQLALLLAACLAGAAGLGLEVVLTNLSGLTLGYGKSAPVGIALYISGWSLGAWIAGTRTRLERSLWLAASATLILVGALGPKLLVALGAQGSGTFLMGSVTALILLAAAIPQGVLLPLLSRHWSRVGRKDLGLLFAANLLGAAAGASLFAEVIPASHGRGVAAMSAACVAGLVGLLGHWWSRQVPAISVQPPAEEEAPPAVSFDLREAGIVLAVVTGWIGTLEWFGVRLGVLWFGGMQATLGNILVASMIALGLGAAVIPALLPRGRGGVAWLGFLCVLSSASLFCLPLWLGGMDPSPSLWRALLLVGPALFPFGAWVPMLHRLLKGETSEALGRLLGFEALGVLVGLPLSHLVLLPLGGMDGALAFWSSVGCLIASRFLGRFRLPSAILAASLVGASILQLAGGSPALASPPLSNPQLEILDLHEGEHFVVSVVNDGVLGERTLMTDGFRAAASGRDYAYMRALGHLPLLVHGNPAQVGVLAFGTGTTAGSVSMHAQVESIEVLELSSAVTDRAEHFEEVNHGVLDDGRVTLTLGDGRDSLARRAEAYDVLTMEPLLPDSPFGVYLYTEEFYARAKGSLKPGGLLCQWVPPHALEPRVFDAVLGAFTSAFDWSSIWVFGTQVILLGSESAPRPSSASFRSMPEELRRELGGLGLDSLEGVLARYVVSGDQFPAPKRPLRDIDPWVIFRPRRAGREAIADLPRNLARLRTLSQPIPTEWWVELDEFAEDRLRALALVRQAREAAAVERARALGVDLSGEGLASDSAGLLEEAGRLAINEAGVIRLEAEIEFFESLQRAKLLLAGNRSEEGSAAAAALLSRATALRPERADVHAYLSVALERLGSDRAAREMAKALELCPRLMETRVGEQLRVWKP